MDGVIVGPISFFIGSVATIICGSGLILLAIFIICSVIRAFLNIKDTSDKVNEISNSLLKIDSRLENLEDLLDDEKK